jgi:hypothetical protein
MKNFTKFSILMLLLLGLVCIVLTSCTYRLQGSHGERLHANAMVGSPTYHLYTPYHPNKENPYKGRSHANYRKIYHPDYNRCYHDPLIIKRYDRR